MTLRITALSALALAAVAASPASAQQTFNAWGHEFNTVGGSAAVSAQRAPTTYDSYGAHEAGLSARYLVDRRAGAVVNAPVSSERTLNVWGARIDAPAR